MKPAPNAPQQIAAFIAAVYEPDDWIEIRPLPSARSTWHRAGDIDLIVSICLRLNQSHENVYFGVNPRVAAGRRGNAGVAVMWCVWVDFDGKHLQATTSDEQIAEVRQRIKNAGLPEPTVINYSGHGVHVYWRFTVPVTDLDAWDVLIDALITTLGSDPGAKGRDRIMRVPGLVNWKEPVAMAELVECDPDRRLEWEDIAEPIYRNLPEPAEVESVEQIIANRTPRQHTGPSVIDTFNNALTIQDVLSSAGYDVVGKQFRRPGKEDRGWSGIIRPDKHGRSVSAHWSSNDPLNDERFGKKSAPCGIHDSFSAFTMLEHNGDTKAAVKAAAELLNIPLPKAKSDLAILEAITASDDASAFADAFFEPQTPDTRRTMRGILAKFTTWPAQVDRILAMASSEAVAA